MSDPATYPLILILGCAISFMTGTGVHMLMHNQDVEIDPVKRNQGMRDWGRNDAPSVTEWLVRDRYFRNNNPKGLGVDTNN